MYAPVWVHSERLDTAAEHPSIPMAGPRAADRRWAYRDSVWAGLVRGLDGDPDDAIPSAAARWVAVLPLLIIADLLGSHWYDVPTVDPRYWTEPPESVVRLKADPSLIRVFGKADKSAAEPGYVSERDRFPGRCGNNWTGAWPWPGTSRDRGVRRRSSRFGYLDYTDHARVGGGRFDIESVTHVLTGRRWKERILPAKCDVRLMPWLTDKNEIAGGQEPDRRCRRGSRAAFPDVRR